MTVWLGLLAFALAAPAASGSTTLVPTVECPTDGQLGPQPAAPPSAPFVPVRVDLAPHLAFYRSVSLGVLAPRGWHCLELNGSDGSMLVVTPEPHALEEMRDLRGPAVQLSYSFGGTSGRFAVARAIARLFPDQAEFARQVAVEEIDWPMPSGPYPDDVISRQGPHLVRYRTPAGRQGLGTESRLLPDNAPIDGLVILLTEEEDLGLLQLAVRLSTEQSELAGVIVDQDPVSFGSVLRPSE